MLDEKEEPTKEDKFSKLSIKFMLQIFSVYNKGY